MRRRAGRADLARLVHARGSGKLLSGGVDAAAQALGYWPPVRAAKGPGASDADQASAAAGTTERRVRDDHSEASARAPMPFWRCVAIEHDDHDGSTPAAVVEVPAPELGGSLVAAPPSPPLVPWSRLWPRLRHAISDHRRSRSVDVPALVRAVGRGESLRHIPRRQRRIWPHRLVIWLDRSERLIPLWADQDRIVADLRALMGPANLQVVVLDPGAQAVALRHGHFAQGTPPGATVLLLGDLGHHAGPMERRCWRRTAHRLLRRGCRPVVLWPGDRLVKMAPWQALVWAPGRKSTNEAVEGLLDLVSPAELIQPGLLRVARLRGTSAGVQAELAAWGHSDVAARISAGMVLEREAMTRRRATFAASGEGRAVMKALIDHWHAGLPATIRHLQTLTWRADGGEDPPGDWPAACAWFCGFSARIVGGAESAEPLERFGQSMFQRVSESVLRDPALRDAAQRFWVFAHQNLPEVAVPEGIPAHLLIEPEGVTRRWALHQTLHGLALAPESGWLGTGSPLALFEGAGERVEVRGDGARRWQVVAQPIALGDDTVTVALGRTRVRLARWTRPDWATAAGRDAHGLWAEMTVGAVVQRLRWIPPGRFLMGSPEDEPGRWDDEGPEHSVQLSSGFWMGDTPVTQALWQAVMGANPSHFKGAERPVEEVSWEDAQQFFERLQAEHGAEARLPTEAQWEHACRGGTQTARWAEDLDAIAWYDDNAGGETHPVKEKAANPFGLYDVLGNVWEWCQDWEGPYKAGPAMNPSGPETGSSRVNRGGSWSVSARHARAAYRRWSHPGLRNRNRGLRLVRGQVAEPEEGGAPQAGPTHSAPVGAEPRPAEREGPTVEHNQSSELESRRSRDRSIFQKVRGWFTNDKDES